MNDRFSNCASPFVPKEAIFYENILDRNEVMTNQLISEGLLPKDTKVLTSEMVSGDNGEALRARISDMYLDDYISSRRYGEVEKRDYIYNPILANPMNPIN